MNWIESKDIKLSQNCLLLFTTLLGAFDLCAYWVCGWFIRERSMSKASLWLMLATVYAVSVCGWVCLSRLAKLLLNLKMGEVFIDENVRYLMGISRCCLAVAVICAVSAVYYLPFVFVAVAAAFLFLIVRIVADVFRQSIAMKYELDLTV